MNLYIDNEKLFEVELPRSNIDSAPKYLSEGLHDLYSLFYEFTGLQRWVLHYSGPDTSNSFSILRGS